MSGYSRSDVIWFPGFHIRPERTYTEREVSAIVDARIIATRRELTGRIDVLESELRLSRAINQTTRFEGNETKPKGRGLYIGDLEDD